MPSASTKLAAFFNILRDTGTDLPVSNAELANLLLAALNNLDIDSCVEFRDLKRKKIEALLLTQENLIADMDVMVEALGFIEEDDAPDEEEENEDE
jgi:hypothetical protein